MIVGRDVLGSLATETGRVALVYSPSVRWFAERVASAVGVPVVEVEVPDGEAAKDLAVAEGVWRELGRAAITRTDLVVAVGGGAVTDLAGFVAATWLRGVDVVHVPTTLLGMVDAAIGGKTAINTEAGKNLVGAFHQPKLVVADLAALDTLPRAELVAGLAEVAKVGFIADPSILDDLDDPRGNLETLVRKAARVKLDVVAADFREAGERAYLNYGHTLAHAIEWDAGYGAWRHGEAVSVGLCYAAAVGRRLGLDGETADRHRAVLSKLGLPTTYDASAWPRLRAAMAVDKKSRGSRLRFVVLVALASPAIVEGPDESLLESAYEEVAA